MKLYTLLSHDKTIKFLWYDLNYGYYTIHEHSPRLVMISHTKGGIHPWIDL